MGVAHAKAIPTRRHCSYTQFAPLDLYLKDYPAVVHHSILVASVCTKYMCYSSSLSAYETGGFQKAEGSGK